VDGRSFGPDEQLDGRLLAQARLLHPLALVGDWTRTFDSVRVTGMARVGDRVAVVLAATKGDLPRHELKVDLASGDVLEESFGALYQGPGNIPTVRRYGEYRNALGVRMPFRIAIENEPEGEVVLHVETLEKYEGETAAAFPPSPPSR
jgi:hypothetical protein